MKKTSKGNVILTSHEFLDLANFLTYVSSLPRVPHEDYQRVDYVLLSTDDIALFKKVDRFLINFND